jgi:hypothetical protein
MAYWAVEDFRRLRQGTDMNVVDDVRRLTHYLELCAETGSSAHLTAYALDLLVLVLRAHIEPIDRAPVVFATHSFQIVADGEETEEILALSSGALIASAIFDEAVKRRPRSKIRLRYGDCVLAEAS